MLKPICPSDFITEKDELKIYLKEYPMHTTQYGLLKKYNWRCPCRNELLGYVTYRMYSIIDVESTENKLS